MNHQSTAIEDLFGKTTDYLETKAELLRLKAIGKTSEAASSIISSLVLGVVVSIAILFLNVALAIWLGGIFNQLYLGFLAVAAFYLVVFLILFLGRKSLMKSPLQNSMINKFLN